MVPISWQEMECPRTHVREYRKVAKVTPAQAAEAQKQVGLSSSPTSTSPTASTPSGVIATGPVVSS